jgi:glycosyltransferase involved in cell wall biosynthesis
MTVLGKSKIPPPEIYYLSASRFPTEKAYGFQIVKECECLSLAGAALTFVFPELAARQAKMMETQIRPDLFSIYSVRPVFRLAPKKVFGMMDGTFSNNSRIWPVIKSTAFSLTAAKLLPQGKDRRKTIWTQDFLVFLGLYFGGMFRENQTVFECHDVRAKQFVLLAPLLKRIDKVIATTNGIRRELIRLGVSGDRIIVLPNAVDISEFMLRENKTDCRRLLGLPQDRYLIGYIGKFRTMDQEKGIGDLIRAIHYVKLRSSVPILLLCVGENPEEMDPYRRIAGESGLTSDEIQFVGFQPHSEVARWMKACDVCAIPTPPSRFFTQYVSPMKLFEYLAVGVPIVATDLPAHREIIRDGENGILVQPQNPAALAEGILKILLDPQWAARFSTAGQQTVADNSWERRAEAALEFILENRSLPEQLSGLS